MSRQSRGQKLASNQAFTLMEVILVGALFTVMSAVGVRSMFAFSEQRRLRTAAVELSGFLQMARSVANAANAACTIELLSTRGGSFRTDQSSACNPGSMPSSIDLDQSGNRDLKVEVLEGSYPLTFTPEGTLSQGATVLISSEDVPDGGWCVDVQAPLATVRLGWRAQAREGSGNCNYAIEQ